MKKIIGFILFFLIISIPTKPVFALNPVIRKINPEIIQQIVPTATSTPVPTIKIVPGIKKEIQIKPFSTIKPTKKAFNYEKINQHQNAIKDDLAKRYNNLTNIQLSLEAKIAEKKNTGLDMTKAEAKLLEIEPYIKDYLEDLNNFENKIGEILTSETPGKIMPELRIAVKAVRTDLNSMKKILSDTIKLIIIK